MIDLKQAIRDRKQQGLYRQRQDFARVTATSVTHNGKSLLDFSSNDYLGLSHHPKLIAANQQTVADYGVGSGASHLICGHQPVHSALESALANLLKRDKALVFSTGYMANMGIITALCDKHTMILQDKLNHASLIDAAQHTMLNSRRYLHTNMDALEHKLKRYQGKPLFIVTDGVFSMDGDLAPLDQIADLAKCYSATLMVDDAHGIGVLGPSGGGSAEHFALAQDALPVIMGTLGKAFGVFGAFVAGSAELIDYLIQFARPYIYTTALPPGVAAAALAAVELVTTEPEHVQQLKSNIDFFCTRADYYQLALLPSSSAIQTILLGNNGRCLAVAQQLKDAGFLVAAIRPPTVPKNTARLRITLSAKHSHSQIDDLCRELSTVIDYHG